MPEIQANRMGVTKKDVEKLIVLRKENTFLNHLWNVFSRDMKSKGEINQSEIKVWKQNFWNIAFYPIFTFKFNTNSHLTNITDKLNPVGKTIIGIAVLVFLNLIFSKNLSEFNIIENWHILTSIIFFVLLVIFVARKVYKFEKNNQLEQIFKILDIEVEEKVAEKEWSLKNILIRLFVYPFSIFVITISFCILFENGIKSFFLSLSAIVICGIYLLSDIKMIIKNKKTTEKGS